VVVNIKMINWAEHVASMGDMRNANKAVILKPEKNRTLERSRYR
jgi:hypothetical protein